MSEHNTTDWPGFPPILEDLAAGCPVSEDKAAGMRAALRVIAHRLDYLAAKAAPDGIRNNKEQRAARSAFKQAADVADQIRREVRANA
ncbi:hypothetical protein [Falsiroseomonas sp. CW058]|uniref:hypothetical protein n=1 Tax=Falsiroseomonas sp. CW058 TaxID=3388664 RepID=UPI003D32461B